MLNNYKLALYILLALSLYPVTVVANTNISVDPETSNSKLDTKGLQKLMIKNAAEHYDLKNIVRMQEAVDDIEKNIEVLRQDYAELQTTKFLGVSQKLFAKLMIQEHKSEDDVLNALIVFSAQNPVEMNKIHKKHVQFYDQFFQKYDMDTNEANRLMELNFYLKVDLVNFLYEQYTKSLTKIKQLMTKEPIKI